MLVDQTFKALGDPVRIEMLRRLTDGSRYTVGNISNGLGLTRQGARKHLQVLAKVNLVMLRPKGRQVEVKLNATSLSIAKTFITELEKYWDQRLQSLREYIEDDIPKNSTM